MNTSDLEKNPIPSYLFVEGYEFLATYNGQVATCRYCGQPNHKQPDCPPGASPALRDRGGKIKIRGAKLKSGGQRFSPKCELAEITNFPTKSR